jgi:hypothetical protein
MKKGENSLIFDINKICEFVFGNPNDRTNELEITEKFKYDTESKKMLPEVREVKEVKVNDYTGQNTIRYDMIKMFIDIIDSVEDFNVLTLGQSLTINTLESYGLIKDANDINNE